LQISGNIYIGTPQPTKMVKRRLSVEKQEPGNAEERKEILLKIAELSRLLGMIPSDDTILLSEPLTDNSMELSKWLSDVRDRFLGLSTLVGRALDLQLQ
jgi:hypothetical protein